MDICLRKIDKNGGGEGNLGKNNVLEEIPWRKKKSRALWLKGDKKTSFSPGFLILIIAVLLLQI